MIADTGKIVVAGGDMRQVFLAEILSSKGYQVAACGLCGRTDDHRIRRADTLKEALEDADVVAAPVPFFSAGKISGKYQISDMDVETLLREMPENGILFGGNIPSDVGKRFRDRGVTVYDMMKDEYVAMQNTAATAEGAIAEAIKRSPRNLSKSRCMVLGYGRCGSTLALLLRGFSCHLTVVERDAARAAGASVLADRVLTGQGLAEEIGDAEFIFNTVPEKILNREELLRVKKSAWIFDLASSPGGADYTAASELSLNVMPLPGLPGKYSPETSAEILAGFIGNRLGALPADRICKGSVV